MKTILKLFLGASLLLFLPTGCETLMTKEGNDKMGEADSGSGGAGAAATGGGRRGRRGSLAATGIGGVAPGPDAAAAAARGESGGAAGSAPAAPSPAAAAAAAAAAQSSLGGGSAGQTTSPSRGSGGVRKPAAAGPSSRLAPRNSADTGEDPQPIREDTTGFSGQQPSGRRKRRSATALTIGPASTTRKTLLGQ